MVMRSNGSISARPVPAVDLVATLLGDYAHSTHLQPDLKMAEAARARDLAVELALSTTVLHSEPLPQMQAVAETAQHNAITTADDLLARAGNLTLSENAPPLYEFRALPPRLDRVSDFDNLNDTTDVGSQYPEATEDRRREALADPGVRTLLSEWSPGTTVKDYRWKPWRERRDGPDGDLPHTPIRPRPIRPLPSPRSAQAPKFAAHQHHPHHPYSQPLPFFEGLSSTQPALQRHAPPPIAVFRPNELLRLTPEHSPVVSREGSPVLPSSGTMAPAYPATQIERGLFGGRLETKKKKVKKRAGGF